MILPMPSMGPMGGPPTAYALARRPWVYFVLSLQCVCCVARAVIFLDIMGAFLMAIMIGVGYCAIREEFNVQLLCYWGLMCLINGSFDLVKLIDVLVKTRMPLFSQQAPAEYNIANGLALMIPVSTLMGVPLTWWIYKDFMNGGDALPGPGAAYREGEVRHTEASSLLPGGGTTQTFTAFEGQGRRLGSG
ncbi:unnamed protein product [Effrenium voratum]|uniref:Uncharacterized protein n=1 Tax=Effrenium voratum TaxID=2562239 RepID=A0AA36HK32_9DINO|nr:unnamed protein product [Effrenium voratum]CAJ1437888.1 unnamed protein product [Effrenium voratum]